MSGKAVNISVGTPLFSFTETVDIIEGHGVGLNANMHSEDKDYIFEKRSFFSKTECFYGLRFIYCISYVFSFHYQFHHLLPNPTCSTTPKRTKNSTNLQWIDAMCFFYISVNARIAIFEEFKYHFLYIRAGFTHYLQYYRNNNM